MVKELNGKGDTYRPTDKKRFDKNYDRVFGEDERDEFSYLDDIEIPFKTFDEIYEEKRPLVKD